MHGERGECVAKGGMHGRGSAWGVCMAGGCMCGGGVHGMGCVAGGHVWQEGHVWHERWPL